MTIKTEKFSISTQGFNDLIDITAKIKNIISNFSLKEAVINLSVCASTASIMTLEQEPGLKIDLNSILEQIVPLNKVYNHDTLWYNENATAHLKAALLGNNITLSIINSKLQLGDYQQIVLVDFDTKPCNRTIVVSAVY